MTDFFTRLAERTLGAASVVRPLVSPLSAQTPAVNESSFLPHAGPEEERTTGHRVEETAVRRGRYKAAGDDPRLPGSDQSGEVTPNVHERAVEYSEATSEHRYPSQELQRSRTSVSKESHDRTDRNVDLLHGNIMQGWGKSSTEEGRTVNRETGDTALVRQTTGIATPPAVRESGEMGGHHVRSQGTPKDSRSEMVPVHGAARIISPAQLVAKTALVERSNQRGPNGKEVTYVSNPFTQQEPRHREAAAHDDLREGYRVSAPTVKVTIGRIDVRAIMPAPGPPKPAAKGRTGPAMSLDDYLKERTGGGR